MATHNWAKKNPSENQDRNSDIYIDQANWETGKFVGI